MDGKQILPDLRASKKAARSAGSLLEKVNSLQKRFPLLQHVLFTDWQRPGSGCPFRGRKILPSRLLSIR